MAKSITGVGVRHYVPDMDKYFKEDLHKGDIVYAMPDFESHHDLEHSIALFHHNKMISHVEEGKTNLIEDYFKGKAKSSDNTHIPEWIAFRYRGSHDTDKGTFNLSLDWMVDEEPFKLEDKTYEDFTNTAIYYASAPYVMDEERELYFLAHYIMKDASEILYRDANSPVTSALVDELDGLLRQYTQVACSSLSKDCKQYLNHIIQQLESICEISDAINVKIECHYKALSSLKSQMRGKKLQQEIYNKQLVSVTEVLRDGKFFDKFGFEAFHDRQNDPDNNAIGDEVTKIKKWMLNLPSGIGKYFEKDETAFANGLYDIELHYLDLYLVYAHIAILMYCDELHKIWRGNGPFVLVQQQVINNIIENCSIIRKKEQK